jgi:hypothetical protein
MKKKFELLPTKERILETAANLFYTKGYVNTGIEEITFGSGGGFTGVVKTYKLTSCGKLFDDDTELEKVSSKKTFELFTQAKVLKDVDFNRPDNLYRFIEIKTKEKTNK